MPLRAEPAELHRWLPELLLTACVLTGLGWCIARFRIEGRLPQPFLFDPNDTFMDWFNTAYWAHHAGIYDVWHSIYPPLSFVFLAVVGDPACYVSDGFAARDCDMYGRLAIVAFWLIGGMLTMFAFYRNDPRTAILRGISFLLGLPWLFALERGNLMLVCFIGFVAAYGDIVRPRWGRALAIAVTINFKPYLILPALAAATGRRWRSLELACFTTIGLYLASCALVGDGSIGQLIDNTVTWVSLASNQIWEAIYYSTSYVPFLDFDRLQFPVRDFIPASTFDLVVLAVPIVVNVTRALSLLTLAGGYLQPGTVSERRMALMLLGAYLVGASPGGYAECFIVFLVFLERWRRPGPIVALTAAYVSCIPYDHVFSTLIVLHSPSWLSGREVTMPFGISLGIFLRPALVVVILWSLALDSLALITSAHCRRRPTIDPLATVVRAS